MTPQRYNREVTDDEFRQRVRRHRPSSLLPLVAATGAQYARPDSWSRPGHNRYAPWVLSEVARVSLLHGNEHRAAATMHDLSECCAAYQALADPELGRGNSEGSASGFFLRISSEQFPYQPDPFHDLARTVALFEQTQTTRRLRVLSDPMWPQHVLGCTLPEYVGVGLLLYVAADKNEGRFSIDWLEQPNFEPIVAKVPAQTIRRVITDHFSTSRVAFRRMQPPQLLPAQYRRFSYNPLLSRPLLEGIGETLLMPVPSLVVHKVAPLGIYHTCIERLGNAFAEDVGALFEAYVGRQLQLIPRGKVLSAVTYGRHNQETVDWIVVFEDTVLLVEVKSVRPTEPVRLGTKGAAEEIQRMLSRSREQLKRTAELIRAGHPALSEVPAHLPMVALTVTMESFHVVNSTLYRDWLPDPGIPSAVCSSAELEQLVRARDEPVGRLLLRGLTDPARSGWSVRSLLQGQQHVVRNKVLDDAWVTYPW